MNYIVCRKILMWRRNYCDRNILETYLKGFNLVVMRCRGNTFARTHLPCNSADLFKQFSLKVLSDDDSSLTLLFLYRLLVTRYEWLPVIKSHVILVPLYCC
jgi:hypothetical protein